jgi:hypothetical protein
LNEAATHPESSYREFAAAESVFAGVDVVVVI